MPTIDLREAITPGLPHACSPVASRPGTPLARRQAGDSVAASFPRSLALGARKPIRLGAIAEMMVRLTLVVLGYLAAAQAGWHFRLAPQVTMLWPPIGVALAVLLVAGLRAWPVIVFADLVSGLLLPSPPLAIPAVTYPLLTIANTIAPIAAVWVLTRRTDFRRSLSRLHDVALFVTIGALGASALSATLGAAVEVVAAFPRTMRFRDVWLTWFAGDVMGVLVVTPFLLTWADRRSIDWSPRRIVEAIVLFGLLVTLALVEFGGATADGRGPLVHAIFPFIMWAALRFGLRGASTAHLIACSIAVVETSRAHGPFAQLTVSASLFYLHSFTAMLVMTSLLLGAATSERAASQNVVEQRVAELRAVLSSITDAIFVCDREQRLTFLNPAAAKLTRLRENVSLRDAAELVDLRGADGERLAPDMLPLARGLRGQSIQNTPLAVRPVGADGVVQLQLSTAPIVGSRGIVGAVSVGRDVSERVEFERMKDEFLSVAAHELKTPVTVLKAAAQALLRRGADVPTQRRLEAIDRGADRITRVVQDMLDVSQIHLGRLAVVVEDVDIVALAEATVEGLRKPSNPYDLTVVGPRSLVVRGDRERLSQICRTLVQNAMNYSPQGSRVEVHITESKGRGVLSVVDRGIGIPLDKQGRIFERFYRAHEGTEFDRGGVGVGLYLAREFVVRQGGRMWFSSAPGLGSTFSLELPLATQRSETPGPTPVMHEGTDG